jgi:hypothetical protein
VLLDADTQYLDTGLSYDKNLYAARGSTSAGSAPRFDKVRPKLEKAWVVRDRHS